MKLSKSITCEFTPKGSDDHSPGFYPELRQTEIKGLPCDIIKAESLMIPADSLQKHV
jgi:hypothetical protein